MRSFARSLGDHPGLPVALFCSALTLWQLSPGWVQLLHVLWWLPVVVTAWNSRHRYGGAS